MAHTYGGGGRLPATGTTTAVNPVTTSLTLPAGTTVLWVSIVAGGTTARAGGTPTFNGVALSAGHAKTNAGGTPETCAESWYLLAPATGAAYTLSIPNSGGLGLAIAYGYAAAASGYNSALDATVNTPGNSTNPSTAFTVTDGAIWFGAIGNGANTWNPSARAGTQINDWDAGTWGRGAQYGIKSGTGSQTVSWTFGTSEDWIVQAISFKDLAVPVVVSPSSGTLQVVGQQPTLAFSFATNAWFARLTAAANTWAALSGSTEAVAYPATGTLRFVGQAPASYGSEAVIDGGGDIETPPEADFTAFYDVLGGVYRDFEAQYTVRLESNPTRGVLRVVGQQPSVRQTWSASPTVGVLRLVGQQPTINRIVVPASGLVRFVGQVPLALGSNAAYASPLAGTLTFTGNLPTLEVSGARSVSPGSATLRFIGNQPVLNPAYAYPVAGALRLVGQEPYVWRIVAPQSGRLRIQGFGIVSRDFAALYPILSETTARDFAALYVVIASVGASFAATWNIETAVCALRYRGRQRRITSYTRQRSVTAAARQRQIRIKSCASQ